MTSMLKAIQRSEGWKGLFKGNGINIVRVVPFSGVEFYSFEVYKSYFVSAENPRDKLRVLLCGTLAGITASLTTYPLDITRTYLALQTNPCNSSFFKSVRLIYANEGLFGFYRGGLLTFAGIGPYIGIKMSAFDSLKAHFAPDPSSPSFMLINLSLGAVAAMLAATLTYPSDLLKRRIQMIVRPT
jgi:solute carrier family 25 phosphate transporter 23/24/25/41